MSSFFQPKPEQVPIHNITLDIGNPRISWALKEIEPSEEIVKLALQSSTSDDKTATSYRTLRNSIKINKGIINPITINRTKDKNLTVIEGNTRVQIYKDLKESNAEGDWDTIPAYVYEELEDKSIDAIRLGAHIVGHREWDAYSKAKYLYELNFVKNMTIGEISSFCGGKEADIEKSIEAYKDMEENYRPLVNELGKTFDGSRFSSFKELQNSTVKQAIIAAGYSLKDFSTWVIERKLVINADVRHLKRILKNKEAHAQFIKDVSSGGTAQEAAKLLDIPSMGKIDEIPILELMKALKNNLERLPAKEIAQIKANPEGQLAEGLIDLHEAVENIWELCNLD